MIRINSLMEFRRDTLFPELYTFLTGKFTALAAAYGLGDISGMFSVIILAENEADYVADKLLEFSEEITFDERKYIHTVWASESYSEDIYIPYSKENISIIESRCEDV